MSTIPAPSRAWPRNSKFGAKFSFRTRSSAIHTKCDVSLSLISDQLLFCFYLSPNLNLTNSPAGTPMAHKGGLHGLQFLCVDSCCACFTDPACEYFVLFTPRICFPAAVVFLSRSVQYGWPAATSSIDNKTPTVRLMSCHRSCQ